MKFLKKPKAIKLEADNMHDVIDMATKLEDTDEMQIIQFNRKEPIPVIVSEEILFYLDGPGPQYTAPPKLSLWQRVKEWFSKFWFEFKYGFEQQNPALTETKRYLAPPNKQPGKRTKQTYRKTQAKSAELKLGPRPNKFEEEIKNERTE